MVDDIFPCEFLVSNDDDQMVGFLTHSIVLIIGIPFLDHEFIFFGEFRLFQADRLIISPLEGRVIH